MAVTAAILKIYFELLLNGKAKSLETCLGTQVSDTGKSWPACSPLGPPWQSCSPFLWIMHFRSLCKKYAVLDNNNIVPHTNLLIL